METFFSKLPDVTLILMHQTAEWKEQREEEDEVTLSFSDVFFLLLSDVSLQFCLSAAESSSFMLFVLTNKRFSYYCVKMIRFRLLISKKGNR